MQRLGVSQVVSHYRTWQDTGGCGILWSRSPVFNQGGSSQHSGSSLRSSMTSTWMETTSWLASDFLAAYCEKRLQATEPWIELCLARSFQQITLAWGYQQGYSAWSMWVYEWMESVVRVQHTAWFQCQQSPPLQLRTSEQRRLSRGLERRLSELFCVALTVVHNDMQLAIISSSYVDCWLSWKPYLENLDWSYPGSCCMLMTWLW